MKDIHSVTGQHDGAQPKGLSAAARVVARQLVRPSLAPVRLVFAVAVIDAVGFAFALWFAQYAMAEPVVFRPAIAAVAAVAGAMIAVTVARLLGAYRLHRTMRARAALPRVLGGGVVAAAILALAGQAPIVPSNLAAASPLALLCVMGPLRLAVAGFADWAVASGLTQRRAVLAGSGPEAARLIHGLAGRSENDIRIHAMFDDRGEDRVPDRILDVPLIGAFDDLVRFCREGEIDLILLTLPPDAEARIAGLLARLRVLPVPVHLTAFSADFAFRDQDAFDQLLPASFKPERRLAKRVFDLVLGGAMALAFAPVMALVALAVRLDSPGPVLFAQWRHGFNNRPVRVWKFRTMHADQCDARAERVVTKGDPRVTRIGRFLRRSSLDELPQLFNVLEGTLSLVGPRPHALDARSSRQERFEVIVDGYSARHRLPPGITGWAQIHGLRGEVSDPDSLRARFDHDLYYIANWSIWMDLKIVLRTPVSLFDTRRAY